MKNNTISAAIATLQIAQTELVKQIHDAQNNEQNYTNQIEELRTLPISLDDFSQYLKKHIEFYATTWFTGRHPSNMLIARFSGETAMNKKGWKDFEHQIGEVTTHEFLLPHFCKLNDGDAFSALCFAMPEAMHEKLMTAYRDAIGERWGNEDLPKVELRRASIAALQDKLNTCKTEREALQTSLQELTGGVLGGGSATTASVDSERSVGAYASHMLKGQRLVNPEIVSTTTR